MPMARAACVCPSAAVLTMPATAHIAITASSRPFTRRYYFHIWQGAKLIVAGSMIEMAMCMHDHERQP